ncbi:toll/interleukin-1 receptor domain-containing protein [Amycolatopsis alba]|uniref:TIR domain-containing protein n=1 Tax=Amycolatopsis alba DSM 44262 TaxID=1125972 RepID=A0A229R9V4_AMYAL|nr:toll/interleukin-1 receptor domain-containing protein [Amycolatopsis alba]OXM43426.1 TIR domain-containing protein [Amycolatopsis alba DSM 44262]
MSTNNAEMLLGAGPSGKPLVRVFLSFAGRDEALVLRLWDLLAEALIIDRVYEFQLWRSDDAILVGENWDDRIHGALSAAEIGVVALSNAFLGSEYITGVELPALVDVPGKRVVPLLLRKVSKQADWHGLKSKQIYGYERPFSDARGMSARDAWVNGLVAEVHRVLARYAIRADRE